MSRRPGQNGSKIKKHGKWYVTQVWVDVPGQGRREQADDWKDILENWLNPNVGNIPLSDCNNAVLKELVKKMVEAGLSPKSISNYIQPFKMVVASAVNERGEKLYPREWNHDFCDIPIVETRKQHRPSFTGDEVSKLVAATRGPRCSTPSWLAAAWPWARGSAS